MKLKKEQQKKIEAIAKKYRLKLVVLFGSFASGKNRKDSDVDIAVLGEKDIQFKQHIDLIGDLSEIFKKEADLTVLNRANPLLSFQVSKNAVLLHGKHEDFINFKLHAFHAFNDYAPYFKMERELNKKIIHSYVSSR